MLLLLLSYCLSLKISQRAQRVLSRHLFAPLIDEVGVVEWAGFDVSSFGGGWI